MEVSEMLIKSRLASGMSQQKVADAMHVNKTTIQNWESGYSAPNFEKTLDWFRALGVPMYPYLMELIYPDLMNDTGSEANREALHVLIDELDDFHVDELMYILQGSHGSSPTGTMDLISIYLHLPLQQRACLAEYILSMYEMAQANGFISDTAKVPRTATLEKCVETGLKAAREGKHSYVVEK